MGFSQISTTLLSTIEFLDSVTIDHQWSEWLNCSFTALWLIVIARYCYVQSSSSTGKCLMSIQCADGVYPTSAFHDMAHLYRAEFFKHVCQMCLIKTIHASTLLLQFPNATSRFLGVGLNVCPDARTACCWIMYGSVNGFVTDLIILNKFIPF